MNNMFLSLFVDYRECIKEFFAGYHGGGVLLSNVKEHATLSAGASVDHGVEVETTEDHVNRAADRGCRVSSC